MEYSPRHRSVCLYWTVGFQREAFQGWTAFYFWASILVNSPEFMSINSLKSLFPIEVWLNSIGDWWCMMTVQVCVDAWQSQSWMLDCAELDKDGMLNLTGVFLIPRYIAWALQRRYLVGLLAAVQRIYDICKASFISRGPAECSGHSCLMNDLAEWKSKQLAMQLWIYTTMMLNWLTTQWLWLG